MLRSRLLRHKPVALSNFARKCLSTSNDLITDETIHFPQEDVFSFYEKKFRQYSDKVALVQCETDRQLTYAELISNSRKLASFFHERGFVERQCVGIHTQNSIDYPIAYLGALANGMMFTAANFVLPEHDIRRQMVDAGAKVLFTNTQLLDIARNAAEKSDIELLISMDDKEINDSGVINLTDILQNGDGNFTKTLDIDPLNDVALLLYSSGTTGLPKGVMLTHQNVISNRLQLVHNQIKNLPKTKYELYLSGLPMFHIGGMTGLFLHLYAGSTCYKFSNFNFEEFLSYIQKYKIQRAIMVPPILKMLTYDDAIKRYDTSSLQYIMTGAAPVDKSLITAFKKIHPNVTLRQLYGMTESQLTHTETLDENIQVNKLGSTGVPMIHTESKVVCIESGKDLGPYEPGEVCMRGPQVMKGYWNNELATKNTFSEDGWLHSGDIGYFDEDGHYYIIDRLKELIKYNAFQVAPAELEDILMTHDQIRDVCVIGIPHEKTGEVPRAYIVLKESTPTDGNLTEDQVKDYVKERVAHYKQLRGGVQFVDEIPKTPSGKILRRVLRDQYSATGI